MSGEDTTPARTSQRWVVWLVGLVGLAAAAYPLTFVNMLAGVHGYASGAGYDDGVYLSIALRWVHGALPYRDFLFVHPPGIAWLMSPIAIADRWIGARDALVLCRLATVLVAGLNCALAALAVRHRGRIAMLCAGLILAGFPGAYNADHTLLLEPWLVLFCLLTFVLAFPGGQMAATRPRLLAAGLCAGFAGTIKIWAILPLAAVLIACLLLRRRRSLPFLGGATLGFVLPCLPFIFAAPSAFVRDVFVAQFARSVTGSGPDAATRIGIMTGLKHLGETPSTLPVVGLSLAGLVGVALLLLAGRRRLSAADWTVAAACVFVVVGMFAPVQFYDHYAYFSAAFLALLLGSCCGLAAHGLVTVARGRLPAGGLAWVPAAVPVLVCAALLLAVPQGLGRSRAYFAEATDPVAIVAGLIPRGSCVLFDNPSLVLVGDRLSAAAPGCPPLVDPFGLWLTEADGNTPHLGEPLPVAFVQQWSAWFDQADFIVLSVPGSSFIPFSPELIEQFNRQFYLAGSADHAYVFARAG